MGTELLEDMTRLGGYLYLSDLRIVMEHDRLKRVLVRLDHSRYPVEDWQDAVEYLTGKRPRLASTEEGFQYLWSWLAEGEPAPVGQPGEQMVQRT